MNIRIHVVLLLFRNRNESFQLSSASLGTLLVRELFSVDFVVAELVE